MLGASNLGPVLKWYLDGLETQSKGHFKGF